jgi:hypothetical protein
MRKQMKAALAAVNGSKSSAIADTMKVSITCNGAPAGAFEIPKAGVRYIQRIAKFNKTDIATVIEEAIRFGVTPDGLMRLDFADH